MNRKQYLRVRITRDIQASNISTATDHLSVSLAFLNGYIEAVVVNAHV